MRKMEDGRGWRKGMLMGHSRKGAIDLLQKEAAVNGLFFNESFPATGERRKARASEGPDGKMEFSRGEMEF